MPLNEALAFWRKELSMPACHKHGTKHAGCTHSWQTDERKFTYSVRHLYGLEGARKNYAAPSCATIQVKWHTIVIMIME
jgi:DNA primase large subunit